MLTNTLLIEILDALLGKKILSKDLISKETGFEFKQGDTMSYEIFDKDYGLKIKLEGLGDGLKDIKY